MYVFWGSTYLAIGIADEERLPPAVMCAMRFAIAGSLMLAACACPGRDVRITLAASLARLATIGCLLLVGGNFGLAWAEQFVPTGFAALIVAVDAHLVSAAGDLRLSRRPPFASRPGRRRLWASPASRVLFWPKFEHRAALGIMPLVGASTLLLSSFSWSLGSVASRKWKMPVDPFTATAWEMLFAAVGNAIVALPPAKYRHIVITRRGMLAVLYLVVFGSWVGYSAYIWLLKHVPTPKVATYAYVNPLVAVFLGWMMHSERLDGFMLAGAAVIVAGVALVTTAKVHDSKGISAGSLPELETEV